MDQERVKLDQQYWSERYKSEQTGWDIGYANRALTYFVTSKVNDKSKRILIPGAGNGYEGEYLHALGYKNVFLMDLTAEAKNNFLNRVTSFDPNHYIVGDFFTHHEKYDVILEQTFFCALDPSMRPAYALQMHNLLNSDGCLAGVLFNVEMSDGPPFGGSIAEYSSLFAEHFEIRKIEECRNSVAPRAGKEVFFECRPIVK